MADIKFTAVTDAERLAATPAAGVYLRTTDTKKFYLGDGATAGGILIGPMSPSDTKSVADAQPMGTTALTAARDLADTDQGKMVVSDDEWTLTVQTASAFDSWASCVIYAGGGAVTVAEGASITIQVVDGKSLVIPQYGFATLTKTATANEYVLTGEMGAA